MESLLHTGTSKLGDFLAGFLCRRPTCLLLRMCVSFKCRESQTVWLLACPEKRHPADKARRTGSTFGGSRETSLNSSALSLLLISLGLYSVLAVLSTAGSRCHACLSSSFPRRGGKKKKRKNQNVWGRGAVWLHAAHPKQQNK